MKLHKKKSLKAVGLWFLGAAILGLSHVAPSHAALTADIDIKVTISATKSLAVGTTHYNFGPLTVNTSSVSASAIVVTNDSGALLETYTIQGANAVSTGGGTTWTLAASTGTIDEYVLAAQFSTARPTDSDGIWASDSMTTSAVACSDTQFGNGTLAQAGDDVSPLSGQNQRNLWFRMITPLYVTDVTQRNATITLAVQ